MSHCKQVSEILDLLLSGEFKTVIIMIILILILILLLIIIMKKSQMYSLKSPFHFFSYLFDLFRGRLGRRLSYHL